MFNLKNKYIVVLIYLVIALSCIYFIDDILLRLAADSGDLVLYQTHKEAFYIILTAVIFYFLLKFYTDNLKSQEEELKTKSEQLKNSRQKIKDVNKKLDRTFNKLNKWNQRFVSMIN